MPTRRTQDSNTMSGALALFREQGVRALMRGPVPGILLLVAIGGLSVVLIDLVKARVALSAHYRVDPSGVVLGELPAAVPEDVADDLRDRVRFLASRPITDPTLEADLVGALATHPWVRSVHTVRKVYPSRVLVDLDFRVPAAVVVIGKWLVTIDAAGYVLEDQAARAPTDVPRIVVKSRAVTSVPEPGTAFEAPAVLHGLSVVRDLAAESAHGATPLLSGFTVDATRVGTRVPCEILLTLPGGHSVEWGSAAISDIGAAELSVREKLDSLLVVNDRYPAFVGLATINVTASRPSVRPAD